MSDVRRKAWNYILDCLSISAFSVCVMELLFVTVPEMPLVPGFFLSYFAAYFLGAFLLVTFTAAGEKLPLKVLPILTAAVYLTSWDLTLLCNAGLVLVLFLLTFYLQHLPAWKWILAAGTLSLTVLWIIFGGETKIAAGCLIYLIGASAAGFRKDGGRKWTVMLSLLAVTAMVIPSSEEPMRWEMTRRFFGKVGNFFETAAKNVTFFFEGLFGGDEAYAGYSETGQISGGISSSDREALLFDTTGDEGIIYLRGAKYARLTKDGFPEKIETDKMVYAWFPEYLDALAKSGFTTEEVASFAKTKHATITYQYLRTTDLILPSTVFMINDRLKQGLTDRESKGFSYEFSYIDLDVKNPYFRKLAVMAETEAKNASPELSDYEAASEAAEKYFRLRLPKYMKEGEFEEALKESRENAVSSEYLDCSMATDRMRSLAEELGKDSPSAYDTAERIETYLRKYTYDAAVDLRDSENYVDSFLFETQRGYCVHYASAMVMLLRLNQIPARYVQGFVYQSEDEGVVRNRAAHAWVEAYLPGLGWVRFEPTASMENDGWGLLPVYRDPSGKPGNVSEPVLPGIPEIPTPHIPDPVDTALRKGSQDTGKILLTIGGYLLMVIGLAVLLLLGVLLVRRIRYRRLTPEKKLFEEVRILRKRLDQRLTDGSSAESVFDYLPMIEDQSLKMRLDELFRGYYRVRFRGDAAEDTLIRGMQEMNLRIRKAKTI